MTDSELKGKYIKDIHIVWILLLPTEEPGATTHKGCWANSNSVFLSSTATLWRFWGFFNCMLVLWYRNLFWKKRQNWGEKNPKPNMLVSLYKHSWTALLQRVNFEASTPLIFPSYKTSENQNLFQKKDGEKLTDKPPFLLMNIQKCDYCQAPHTCLLGNALIQRVWYFRLDSLRCWT